MRHRLPTPRQPALPLLPLLFLCLQVMLIPPMLGGRLQQLRLQAANQPFQLPHPPPQLLPLCPQDRHQLLMSSHLRLQRPPCLRGHYPRSADLVIVHVCSLRLHVSQPGSQRGTPAIMEGKERRGIGQHR